jgi:mRNA interferase RelE/StbE
MRTEYSKKAAKAIERMDTATKQRVRQAIHSLPAGDVKQLSGRIGTWRLRIGALRILFSYQDEDAILIEKIAPRGQAYKEG